MELNYNINLIEKIDSIGRRYILTPARIEHARKNSKLYSGFKKGHGKLGNSKGSTGKHWKKTPEQLEKSRLANLGEKNPSWKGGITPEKIRIRMSKKYEIWRTQVFERDGYRCVFCGQVGGRLNADHIKSFANHPELRLDVNNGRTLCIPCHKKTETFGGKSNKKSK